MNLEEIFKKNIKKIEKQISDFGKKNTDIMQLMLKKKKDSQLNKIVNAFALISSSLEFEMQKKLQRELHGIFMNIYPDDFCAIPNSGLLKVVPYTQESFLLTKDKIIRDGNIIYQLINDIYINNIEIASINHVINNDSAYLSLKFKGINMNKISHIDLHFDMQTFNTIFLNKKSVKCKVNNHDMYYNDCDLMVNYHHNLRQFVNKDNIFYFARLSNIKYNGNANEMEILIPISSTLSKEKIQIHTNIIPVENKFITYSTPFIICEDRDNPIPTELDQNIIRVKNLYNIDGDVIPNILNNNEGWHINSNDEDFNICCSNYGNFTGYVELECSNRNLTTTNNIVFEEYCPCSLHWHEFPNQSFKIEDINQISKIIQFIYLSNNDILNIMSKISDLISVYNQYDSAVFSDIDILTRIKPKKIGNSVFPSKYYMFTAKTPISNITLLSQIVETIRRKYMKTIDFMIITPLGEMIFED
jgi:hypothetical protein